jgi:oligopeptide/dipeptide ABC transporter ATP-binding protein
MTTAQQTDTIIEVNDLRTYFFNRNSTVKAVDGVSFHVRQGETLGIVGESGCGKTMTALSLLRLIPRPAARIVSGEIWLNGQDLLTLSDEEMRLVRGRQISMILQDPQTSLNPVFTIGNQLVEALAVARRESSKNMLARAVEALRNVNVAAPQRRLDDFPHQMSGGMKQRVVGAIAMSCEPGVIIADEPTTALDVIVQDRILREMQAIQRSLDMSMIYISHDMAVIAEVCDVVGVMYAGKLVEFGPTAEVYGRPIHPYTRALMSAFPSVRGEKHDLATLPGEPPDLLDPPGGCSFHPRCEYATDECRTTAPPAVRRGDHWAVCWNPPDA